MENLLIVVVIVGVAGLSIYAWKDWFWSLCGLILLTAVVQNPSFPESIASIPGLNLWNILFANMFLAWLVNRRRQGFSWDMPTSTSVFLILMLGVILVGWTRLMLDANKPDDLPMSKIIMDRLINMIKWPLIFFPLFDGCRTRYRINVALACLVLLFVLFAVQIAMSIGPSALFEPGVMDDDRLDMPKKIGVTANGGGKIMSGVPWAILALMPLLKKRTYKFILLGPCIASMYALALAGSRSGYIACVATLVLLCLLRWRRYLLLLPLAVLILPIAVPGATARMLWGIGEIDVSGEKTTDKYNVTAGRNEIWPVVISKIGESPVFGFGREGMRRAGVRDILENVDKDVAMAHPHNAYLEVLLDNGLIGFVIIVGFHIVIWVYSVRLFADRGDPLFAAAGGFALALLTGHLVAFMGGQSFYPKAIDVGLWCAMGVMLRLYVTRCSLVTEMNRTSVANTWITKDTVVSQTQRGWANS